MEKEKKQKVHYLGKSAFLLGKRKEDSKKVYLEIGSWDCDWYWGFGYLVVYNQSRSDVDEFYHFDSLLKEFGLNGIEKHFKSFVLKENEMWILADLMSSYYKLKEVAEFYYMGNSNFTEQGLKIKNRRRAKVINKDIERIIKEVEKLLTP